MAKILIVDDERSIRSTLNELLTMESHTVEVAQSGAAAIEKLATFGAELIISDIKMPGMDGTELLTKVKEQYPAIQVIMISGHGTIETAMECMRQGASDFIEKPIEMNRLLTSVRLALERGALKDENRTLRRKIVTGNNGVEIIGNSQSMVDMRSLIAKIAATDVRVLITGSNGTGKELVARQLHLQSARAEAPFVEVNCAAIPADLIESELFGHEKGSFTSSVKQHKGKFELAQGGTIFMDEIGDMSLPAQAKMLRVLQEKRISRVGSENDLSIDVRVLAATNKDLMAEIDQGRFREDLYHRLNVIHIQVPRLSERKEDIKTLTNHFLKIICTEQNVPLKSIDNGAIELFEAMPWRGNIRELRNAVERLVILSDAKTITQNDVNSFM